MAQRREIEDRQLDEAALGLELPEELKAIRERAVERQRAAPFETTLGSLQIGHFVEVVAGEESSSAARMRARKGFEKQLW